MRKRINKNLVDWIKSNKKYGDVLKIAKMIDCDHRSVNRQLNGNYGMSADVLIGFTILLKQRKESVSLKTLQQFYDRESN